MNSTWTLDQLLDSNLVSCPPDCSVAEAVQRLYDAGSAAILIEQQSAPVGIWTTAAALRLDLTRPYRQQAIAEVMAAPVATIAVTEPAAVALAILHRQNLDVLLVTDPLGHPIGLLERSALPPVPRSDLPAAHIALTDLMHRADRRFAADAPLTTVIEALRQLNLEAVAVSYAQDRYGIVTPRDILPLIAHGEVPTSVGASARPLPVCTADTSLVQALRLQLSDSSRHLGVLGRHGQLLGTVSQAALLAALEAATERTRTGAAPTRPDDRLNRNDYELITEIGNDLVWDMDTNCNYRNMSANVRQLLGHPADFFYGKTPFESMPAVEAERAAAVIQASVSTGQPFFNLETVHRHRNGSTVVFNSTGIPYYDKHGELAGYHGLDRDITRRKRTEQLALIQRNLLTLLATGENIHKILEYLCLKIEELAPVGSMCSVLLVNPDGKTLRLGAAPNIAETLRNTFDNFPIGQCNASCGTAVFRGEQVIVDDIVDSPLWDDYRKLALAHGFRACWSAPFKSRQGDILGTFAISHAVPRRPEEFDFELLKTGLSLASIIVEKQKADEELRLAAITFETNEGIFITDHDGKILRVNRAFSRITGYAQQEVLGKNPRLLQSGRQPPSFYEDFWDLLKPKGQWSGEMHNRRKNGEVHPIWQTITAVRTQDDTISHFVSTFSDISDYKKAEAQIERLAYYDPLTHLPNRRLLYDRLQQQLRLCRRHSRFGAVLFLDLDDFKKINDSLGHPIGDQLLIEVAARFKSAIREEDTCARLGGDEFVILLGELGSDRATASINALTVARKIKASLDHVFILNNYKHYVSSSIGVSLYPENTDTVDDILRQGDTAMYRAKASGRNQTVIFHDSMRREADDRLTLEKDLREALEHGGLQLYYQAQFNNLNEIIGAEALIRWPHPHKGLISPDEFIPIAEDSGLITQLGDWIFEQVCRQLQSWQTRHLKIPHIAVNISPKQFYQPEFVSTIRACLNNAGVASDRIVLELTEGLLIKNISETVDKMKILKAMGFRFSIDDFGTGYSSLAYLKRLPLDQLKIDQSFIRDIDSNPHDVEIVKTIIAMTQNLCLDVIAEGVEQRRQVDFLLQNGCRAYQGYYFAKPMPAPELEQTFAHRLQSDRN